MISGWNSAGGWLATTLGIVIQISFASMVVMSVLWLFRAIFYSTEEFIGSRKSVHILKRRYAKGELSLDDYNHMKRHIASRS